MAGHRSNQIRVFDLFVQVANEGAASHVAGCYLIDGAFHLQMGKRVNDRDDTVDTCLGQYLTDGIIVLEIDVLGKQHLALTAVQAFNDE